MKNFVVACILVATLAMTGCGRYLVHPNSPDTVSSQAFDSLLVASAAIDQAKLDLAKGGLPSSTKPVIDNIIGSYNLAKKALTAYVDAKKKGVDIATYLKTLTADIKSVEDQIRAMRGL